MAKANKDNSKTTNNESQTGGGNAATDAENVKLEVEDTQPEDESGAKPESVMPDDDATLDESGGRAPENETGKDDPGFEEKLKTERDKYLRLAAEYDNFRKRSIKEREMIYGDARADTITRLLPVYDNLERALKMECADEAFYKGIELTMTHLTEILENMDVRIIPAVGEPFDPNRHNAVMTVENPDLGEKVVAEELQKGFILGERVIRFSTVAVAN